MSLTKITTNVIADDAITADKISNTVSLGGPKIANVQYADATFTVINDTAANTSGTARLIINGDGFNSGVTVIVGSTPADSVTRISSTQLRANVTPQVAGSYPIYVQNTDGGTAIRVNGVTFSNTPIWGTAATLSDQAANTAFAVNLSANSDSAVTYSNTSALPAGTTLLANGLFYGTVTIGAETTYNFTVEANDAENQEVPRTFSLTVTVTQAKLFMWGLNSLGALGLNDIIYRSSPVQVGNETTWSKLSLGSYSSLGVKTNGTLWAWGYNNSGQLGHNDRIHRSSPTQVGSVTNWNLVSTGAYWSIATKTDNTLWTWGTNSGGQLGNNTTTSRSSPVQVGTDSTWSLISTKHYSVMAIKTNGTLWFWGPNSHGQSALNDTAARSSPTQVGSDTNWSLVKINYLHGAAIKTDGTLWAWGRNQKGQLGQNNVIYRSSPVQVGSSTDWSKVSVDFYGMAAIKTNGTLWTWGFNGRGQLGNNNLSVPNDEKSSPIQVGSSTNWSLIESGHYSKIATKTDGTLWTWGRNVNGELGLNDIVDKSSPVQIGSATNWNLIGAGERHSFAITQ